MFGVNFAHKLLVSFGLRKLNGIGVMQINTNYTAFYQVEKKLITSERMASSDESTKYVDKVSISAQAYQAFNEEQLNNDYKPGEVMAVADNRDRNYSTVIREEFLQKINQSILDQRTGIDREKLEELEAKMKEIADNPNLSEKQKEEMLAALEEERMALIEEAAKRREEAERREEFQNE